MLLEEAGAGDAPPAKLTVLLNGKYVTTLKRAPHSGVREARFRLPQSLLQRHNQLIVSRELAPRESCPSPHPDEYFAIGGDSTLDLRRATQIAALPDLGQLASSGFPFTRAEDLAETAIVLPDVPRPRALSVLLGLAGQLARLSGKPALGAAFVLASDVELGLDRDLILAGAAYELPLLSRWRERVPVRFGDDGSIALRSNGGPDEWWRRLFDRDDERAVQLERVAQSAHPGVIASFESPLERGRTVLVVTARQDEDLPLPDVLDRASLAGDRADVLIVADGKSAAFAVGRRYVVGRMGFVQRQLWYLSLRPYLLVLLMLVSAWGLARGVLAGAGPRARARLLLLLLLFAHVSRAHADEPAAADLAVRARFWEAQGRFDKAAEIWQQLLRLEPESESAQAGLARCQRPQPTASDEALDKSLSAARALAAEGRYDDAVAAYRRVLGPHPPARVALEYYETLAGTAAGRVEAEAALAEMAAAHPDKPELALAHARALTYDERTRPAGMAELGRLLTVRSVAREARAALERARSWSEAATSARGEALTRGYALLNEGNPDRAADVFTRALLAAPRDAEALVGLSWVRIKQSRFVEARTLAEKARREAPSRKLWQEPLRVATLWSALAEVTDAAERRDWVGADRWLDRALEVSPDDVALVTLRRAEVLLRQDKAAEAEHILRPLVASAPYEAVPLLVEALLRQAKRREADEAVHDAVDKAQPGDPSARSVRVAIARAMARAMTVRGDDATALLRLREALALDPDDRAVQLALIYRELEADETAAAVVLSEKLRRDHPSEPDVLVAAATALQQDGRSEPALATLETIAAAQLSRDGRALRDQLSFAARTRAALALSSGQRPRRLEALEMDAVLDGDLLAILADAWAKAGQRQRALASVHRALAAAPSRGARLRCAGVLVGLGAPGETELVRLLDDLDAETDLTTRERHLLARARMGLAVRQVDEDRRAGEYRRAFLRLEPSLQAMPDEPSLLAALARLQASAGHPGAALDVYRKLVARDPEDLAFTEGAAFAALASGQGEQASLLAAGALKLHPSDPRAYLLAGRIAVARGNDRLGHELFGLGLERTRRKPAEPADDAEPLGTGALLADARAQLVGDATEPESEEEPPPIDRALTIEKRRLDVRYAPWLGGGVTFRFRSGDPGLSRLFEVDVPLVLQASPRAQAGRFTAQVVPTYATAQSIDLTDPAIADVYGADGIFNPTTATRRQSTDVGGVSLALRYDYRAFFAELGSTPIGFRVVNVVGQAGWLGSFGPWSFGLRGFRMPVTDSVLSFAGLHEPRSGVVWGGVTREGGQVDANYDPGELAIHAYASYSAFTGKHVAANHGGQYDLKGMWRFYQQRRQTVAIGLELFIAHYAKNLRFFTFGQGGYFSPQLFLFTGVPLTWELHTAEWTFGASAALGVNWYQEDASAMFPADGAMQRLRQSLTDPGVQFHDAWFPGVEHVSAFGKLHLGVTHDFGSTLSVQGGFDGQFGPAYSEILLILALHHVFL
jgi:tetratricopeptide (TPR) repeat protein